MNKVEQKILQELTRYNNINRYIQEQDAAGAPPVPPEEPPVDAPPAPDAPLTPEAPPAPEAAAPAAPETPEPVDVENDPEVEKIDTEGESEEGEDDTEELDITDLVTSQKDIGQKQEDYFNQLFSHLENLESKLGEMDRLMDKVNSLEVKLEKYRPRTAQEKLELRSLDSGPFNQKLSDFFTDKEIDLEKTGKNEYVLTSDDVENFTQQDIKDSFLPDDEVKNFGI